jgi:hypothetical protein
MIDHPSLRCRGFAAATIISLVPGSSMLSVEMRGLRPPSFGVRSDSLSIAPPLAQVKPDDSGDAVGDQARVPAS